MSEEWRVRGVACQGVACQGVACQGAASMEHLNNGGPDEQSPHELHRHDVDEAREDGEANRESKLLRETELARSWGGFQGEMGRGGRRLQEVEETKADGYECTLKANNPSQ